MALHGNRASILFTSQPGVTMTNLVLQDSGDHKTFFVPTAQASQRIWDPTAAFTFETSPDGAVWSSATPATVQYINGKITFAVAVSGATPSARVATGKYLAYAAAVGARDWTPDVSRDEKEDTSMTTTNVPTHWRTFKPGLLSGTFKLSEWLADDTYLNLITSETALVASLIIDVTTGARLDCAVFPTKDALKSMVNDLDTEELEFRISGQVYLTAA
jgi:hypothetical protein